MSRFFRAGYKLFSPRNEPYVRRTKTPPLLSRTERKKRPDYSIPPVGAQEGTTSLTYGSLLLTDHCLLITAYWPLPRKARKVSP
jgi:hypothetical protein